MPAYDSTGFRPPAPVALVTVRSLETNQEVTDVPMLMDTGADVSLLPRELIADLPELKAESRQYELEAFDGTRSWAPVAQVELLLLGKSFRGQFLVVDGRHGIVGRNILNALSLAFDGPARTWRENR